MLSNSFDLLNIILKLLNDHFFGEVWTIILKLVNL